MQGILLDREVSVWRRTAAASLQFNETQVYSKVRCAVVPISRLDQVSPFALESTHLIWTPYWLVLRKEDRIHDGRRSTLEGDVLPYVYTINGRREFRLGIPQVAYYARLEE